MTSVFQPLQHLPCNTAGVDFVVGDIHGAFDQVYALMKKVGFDGRVDRLITTGDLVDRGPLSHLAIDFLKDTSCYSVRGNHEEMIIGYCDGLASTDEECSLWQSSVINTHLANNGARWFLDEPRHAKMAYANAFRRLPYAIDVKTSHGHIGIIHASCPVSNWADLKDALEGENKDDFMTRATWSRRKLKTMDTAEISGIQWVIVGHSIVDAPTLLGNTLYIDTGAYSRDHLTAIRLDTMEAVS